MRHLLASETEAILHGFLVLLLVEQRCVEVVDCMSVAYLGWDLAIRLLSCALVICASAASVNSKGHFGLFILLYGEATEVMLGEIAFSLVYLGKS